MRLPVIGLTGLPCTGKSFVGGILAGLGAAVLHTDRVGHEVLEEPEVKKQVAGHFGDGVLTADGNVDRAAVGERVFAVAADREWLQNLTHPLIKEHVARWIAENRGRQPLVIEAALLAQSGLADDCDILLVLEADDAVRAVRAERNRGWSAATLEARDRLLREPLAALRDPAARRRWKLPDRIVFLANNGGPDAPTPMENLLEPLRELLQPVESPEGK